MSQQYFYIKFIISLAFVTNGITLLDVPHKAMVFIGKFLLNRKQKNAKIKAEFVDEREFEFGYNYSYVFVVFLNCLLFSTIVPLIPICATFYFWIKYWVDKNNLLFVYVQKYESGGSLRKHTINYMVFNLTFYMIASSYFFSNQTGKTYVAIIGFVITILIFIFLLISMKKGFKLASKEHEKDDLKRKSEYVAQSEEEQAKVT